MPRVNRERLSLDALVLRALQQVPDGLNHPEACARAGCRWAEGSGALWHLVDTGRAHAHPAPQGSRSAYRFQAVG